MNYGPLSYWRLGATYPRDKVREPYPEPSRTAARDRGNLVAILTSEQPVTTLDPRDVRAGVSYDASHPPSPRDVRAGVMY